MDIPDYDPGLLNDYGGGNVDWWWDYIRAEINRCNEYWRSQLEDIKREPEDSADDNFDNYLKKNHPSLYKSLIAIKAEFNG